MDGHHYARAVKAYSIVNTVLADLLLTQMKDDGILDQSDIELLKEMLKNVSDLRKLELIKKNYFLEIYEKFNNYLDEVSDRGPTAKLWVQFFKLTTLIKQFLEVERSGNWQLHLDTVQRMLPIFHAAGHYKYAEFGHLYLQDMLELEKKMDVNEYNKFVTQGFFTIRRTEKFFCGVFSDQTIEQMLMRLIKIKGGLINRGLSDPLIGKWVGTLVVIMEIATRLSEFTRMCHESSEQHKDGRESKVSEDIESMTKIMNYFVEHNPFPHIDVLISIDSGLKGSKSINCYKAFEISLQNLEKVIGRLFTKFKLKKTDRVVPLAGKLTQTKIHDQFLVDPEAVFTRLLKSCKNLENLLKYIIYECAPFPLSLFTV